MLNLSLLPANLKGNESKSQIHPTLTRLLHKKVRWDVGRPGHWQNSGITVELRKCNFPTSPCHLHPFSTWQPDQQFPFGTMNNTERNPNKLPTVSKALHYLPSFPFTVLRPQTPRALPASAFFLPCSSASISLPRVLTWLAPSHLWVSVFQVTFWDGLCHIYLKWSHLFSNSGLCFFIMLT